MPRKGPGPKRPGIPDPGYGATIVRQLVNQILLDGQKGLGKRIGYAALPSVTEKTGPDSRCHAHQGAR